MILTLAVYTHRSPAYLHAATYREVPRIERIKLQWEAYHAISTHTRETSAEEWYTFARSLSRQKLYVRIEQCYQLVTLCEEVLLGHPANTHAVDIQLLSLECGEEYRLVLYMVPTGMLFRSELYVRDSSAIRRWRFTIMMASRKWSSGASSMVAAACGRA